MPRLDAHIPAGALTPAAEAQLLSTLTDLLIRHEGGDPTDPVVRSIAWVFLHRPEAVYVAGVSLARVMGPPDCQGDGTTVARY
jgi:phenylpyruvate tautomerase PptA (4-oxalocrotonate tautomerase family)